MERLFKFKYPKIALFVIAIILAYVIFKNPAVGDFVSNLNSFSYLGVFIAGMLFSFGFTTPFAVGFFLVLNPENILLSAVIGGLGALLSDLLIFKLIRFSFMDEFLRLEKTKTFKEISYLFDKFFHKKVRMYLLYAFAGIVIASPLPDEIGVMMLAGLTRIKIGKLAIISFIMNTIGILILLAL